MRCGLSLIDPRLDGIEHLEEGRANPFHLHGREGSRYRHRGRGGAIRRPGQAGRSTFFCPRCQREHPVRAATRRRAVR